MNFLAHLALSNDDQDLMLGNFVADFVRSAQWDDYHPKVVEGIRLHHSIDFFTDNHQIVASSKERLRPRHGKYSPVVVDILYDHLLARNFEKYYNDKLEVFADSCYQLFHRRWSELPRTAQRILPYMEAQNWLVSYGSGAGLERTFAGMSRRASFKNEMAGAVSDLVENYDSFEEEFKNFFPLLQEHVRSEIEKMY